jgi:hypothetical protein
MDLTEIKKNKTRFIQELQAARLSASSEVNVNSGVRSAEDVSSIIGNRIIEKPDWEPLYQYAMQFD